MHEFLTDRRQVHSWMALVAATTSDPSLHPLSARWTDRVLETLSTYVHTEQAVAIEAYLNGAVMHAAMHDDPLTTEDLTRTIRAILSMSDAGEFLS